MTRRNTTAHGGATAEQFDAWARAAKDAGPAPPTGDAAPQGPGSGAGHGGPQGSGAPLPSDDEGGLMGAWLRNRENGSEFDPDDPDLRIRWQINS